jgi:hypothetical protein
VSCRLRLTQRVLRSSRRTAGALLVLPKESSIVCTPGTVNRCSNRSFGGWLPAHALRSRLRGKNGEGEGHHQPPPQYTPHSGKVKGTSLDRRARCACPARSPACAARRGGGIARRWLAEISPGSSATALRLCRVSRHCRHGCRLYVGRRAQPSFRRWQQAHGICGGSPVFSNSTAIASALARKTQRKWSSSGRVGTSTKQAISLFSRSGSARKK